MRRGNLSAGFRRKEGMKTSLIVMSLLSCGVLFSAESPAKLISKSLQSKSLPSVSLPPVSSEVSQTLSELVEIDPDGPLGQVKSDLLEASEVQQVLEVNDPLKEVDEMRELSRDIEVFLSETWNEEMNFDEDLFLSVGKSEEVEATWESSEREAEETQDPFTSLEMPPL